jgi:hypothetical protein
MDSTAGELPSITDPPKAHPHIVIALLAAPLQPLIADTPGWLGRCRHGHHPLLWDGPRGRFGRPMMIGPG